MSFLKSLELTNFRIFQHPTSFEFAPITMLVGPNNSGKSTLIKSLQLLAESANDNFMSLFNKGTETGYDQIKDLFYCAPTRARGNQTKRKDSDNEVISFKFEVDYKDEKKKQEWSNPLTVLLQYKSYRSIFLRNRESYKSMLWNIEIVDSKGKPIIDKIDESDRNDGIRDFYMKKTWYPITYDERRAKEFEFIEHLTKFISDKFIYLPASRNHPQREYNRGDSTFLSKKLFDIIDGKAEIYQQHHDPNFSLLKFKVWNPESLGKMFVFTNEQIKDIFSIGEYASFRPSGHLDNHELVIHRKRSDTNIVDLGFGTSNLISLLLCIDIAASTYRGKQQAGQIVGEKFIPSGQTHFSQNIILCEEPELSLHPNFQSKLSDVFVNANNKFGITFICETHSEYLIRKLQYLVAKGKVSPQSVAIYYFPSENDRNPPYRIEILNDGRLTKPFGKGFYDESTNIMLNILSDKSMN